MSEKSVHGHEVMRMMIASDKVWTHERLLEAIHQTFGAGTLFYTCTRDNMTASELIAFLEARDKFVANGEGFTTNESHICNH